MIYSKKSYLHILNINLNMFIEDRIEYMNKRKISSVLIRFSYELWTREFKSNIEKEYNCKLIFEDCNFDDVIIRVKK